MTKIVKVVCYKETEIDTANVLTTECGVCEKGYLTDEEAIKQVTALVEDKMSELVGREGYSEDCIDTTTNENGDYQSVTVTNGNLYEYYVRDIDVEI